MFGILKPNPDMNLILKHLYFRYYFNLISYFTFLSKCALFLLMALQAWVLKQCDRMTCFSGLRDVDYVWLWGDIVDGSADVNNYRYYLGYALTYFGVAFVVEESPTESLDGVSIVSNLLPDNTSTGDIDSSLGHKETRRWSSGRHSIPHALIAITYSPAFYADGN